MSKETRYFCNLCTEKKEPTDLLCVYWDCTKQVPPDKFGAYVLVTDVTKADRHLCKTCFKMINDFVKEYPIK